jgi:SAM-dependent methyltransferase
MKLKWMLARMARVAHDPGLVVDRLYHIARGTHPGRLRSERDTDAGALRALATLATHTIGDADRENLADAFGAIAGTVDGQDLAGLFARHGSDKSTVHDYYIAYAGLLSGRRHEQLAILEIGLGTNNTTMVSNMGEDGRPGASLRAFRDWAPDALVFGADIDKEILFAEERITTDFVDQTDTGSLASLVETLRARQFDLIVDDGLHTSWANLNTLNVLLPLLAPGGTFVVEDILDTYLPAWEIAAALLKSEYRCRLIRCKAAWIFLVQRA